MQSKGCDNPGVDALSFEVNSQKDDDNAILS